MSDFIPLEDDESSANPQNTYNLAYHGQSGNANGNGGHVPTSLAEDVRALIREVVGEDPNKFPQDMDMMDASPAPKDRLNEGHPPTPVSRHPTTDLLAQSSYGNLPVDQVAAPDGRRKSPATNPASRQHKATSAGASRATRTRPPSPSPPPLPNQLQFLLFGSSENDMDNLIPKRSLQNLPPRVLRKLAANGGNIDGPSLYMRNYGQFESMIRLKQYLDGQKYTPFKPRVFLEHVLPNGTTASWEPGSTAPKALLAIKVTENTLDLLRKETDLYFFAMSLSYSELRRASARNIIHNYPKSINGIWMLVERVFAASHPDDKDLRAHICDLITSNRQEITVFPPYEQLMRKNLRAEGLLGNVLLDAYMKAADDNRRIVAELPKKDGTRSISLKSTPSAPPTIGGADRDIGPHLRREASHSSAVAPARPAFNGPDAGWPASQLRPSDLPRLTEALNNTSLFVAKKNGYGTLCRPGRRGERNRDFTLHAGELLLHNAFEGASTGNNLVVYNSWGERGDILRDLVWPVPEDVGIPPRERGMSHSIGAFL
jgi:hypothetical protein